MGIQSKALNYGSPSPTRVSRWYQRNVTRHRCTRSDWERRDELLRWKVLSLKLIEIEMVKSMITYWNLNKWKWCLYMWQKIGLEVWIRMFCQDRSRISCWLPRPFDKMSRERSRKWRIESRWSLSQKRKESDTTFARRYSESSQKRVTRHKNFLLNPKNLPRAQSIKQWPRKLQLPDKMTIPWKALYCLEAASRPRILA